MVCVEPKKIEWCDEVEPILLPVLGDDLAEIRDQVKKNQCELWAVENAGFYITRAELDSRGYCSEFVFVAGIGKNGKSVLKFFEKGAKVQGFKKFRIHSKRNGMGRYLKPEGFKPVEVVYKKDL